MAIIIGINAYHGDSSACLVKDGQLIAAVEEERFRRIKHWAGFPSESIKYCMNSAGVTLSDVEHIAVNSDPQANFLQKLTFTLRNRPDFKFLMDRLKNKSQRANVAQELEQAFPGELFSGQVHHIEHHLSHLASAHNVSPFEESITVSVDGFGDFSSAAWGVGRAGKIDIAKRVLFPHSLGVFYQAMTQFIGFPHYGDEYKVMGLAPYGEPKYLDKMREIVVLKQDGTFELNLDVFRHHKEKVQYEWKGGSPSVGTLFNEKLAEYMGLPERKKGDELLQKHKDLARSVQVMYEEAFFNIIEAAHKEFGIDNLTVAGGCGMNSVANGKVLRKTAYKNLYVQSAAGDAGGAIGSAYVVADNIGEQSGFTMDHAYWGPEYNNDYHKRLLETRAEDLSSLKVEYSNITDETELCTKTAQAISEGLVIGWFQGRLEWGPRALGNRSILGDPRREDMKDILNRKIKKRESFRPFAPSILREDVSEWFEEEGEVPFMMQVYQIQEEKRKQIPAVTHADGSGRLQTVYSDSNSRYHTLISKFKSITGVPMVLNTSFNENEPVVCRPEEALDCFLRTNMDVLVLGNWYVRRV